VGTPKRWEQGILRMNGISATNLYLGKIMVILGGLFTELLHRQKSLDLLAIVGATENYDISLEFSLL